jgi:hypothetical protein
MTLTRVPIASEHRLHPGDQLAGAERLGEVVVGADFEANDAVRSPQRVP